MPPWWCYNIHKQQQQQLNQNTTEVRSSSKWYQQNRSVLTFTLMASATCLAPSALSSFSARLRDVNARLQYREMQMSKQWPAANSSLGGIAADIGSPGWKQPRNLLRTLDTQLEPGEIQARLLLACAPLQPLLRLVHRARAPRALGLRALNTGRRRRAQPTNKAASTASRARVRRRC